MYMQSIEITRFILKYNCKISVCSVEIFRCNRNYLMMNPCSSLDCDAHDFIYLLKTILTMMAEMKILSSMSVYLR